MLPNECEKMSDEWWLMTDEWWMMEIEWWKMLTQTGSYCQDSLYIYIYIYLLWSYF